MSEVNYVSFRNLPLVTQHIIGFDNEPHTHLTVEDYCKWYGAEIIRADGTIERVNFGEFNDYADSGCYYKKLSRVLSGAEILEKYYEKLPESNFKFGLNNPGVYVLPRSKTNDN